MWKFWMGKTWKLLLLGNSALAASPLPSPVKGIVSSFGSQHKIPGDLDSEQTMTSPLGVESDFWFILRKVKDQSLPSVLSLRWRIDECRRVICLSKLPTRLPTVQWMRLEHQGIPRSISTMVQHHPFQMLTNSYPFPGNRVHISFRRMDIEATDFCNTDFVEVHESGPSGPLLGHFCGNEIPANITAARELWVLFRTDAEGQAPGFLADYSLGWLEKIGISWLLIDFGLGSDWSLEIVLILVHGNELSGSRGYVESPLYPLPLYMLGTYTWRILVNQSQAIRIRFNAFDFEFDSTTDSCGNFLKVCHSHNAETLLHISDWLNFGLMFPDFWWLRWEFPPAPLLMW